MDKINSNVESEGAGVGGFATSVAPRIAPDFSVRAIPAAELTPDLVGAWESILERAPSLNSPYFQPQYTRIAASVLPNIEVAVMRDGPDIIGFFPFERHAGVVARPVGRGLSDYQGVIALPDAPWTVNAMLTGCGLKAWEFNHQLVSQIQLAPYFRATGASWRMNVSAGYESFLAARKAATTALSEQLRKLRKLQREHEVRFVWHTAEESVLQRLIDLKAQHYLRTSGVDPFAAHRWIKKLMRAAIETQTPQFAGILSATYAGDMIIAAQFSLRSGSMIHNIFPTYDVRFSRYSPGGCHHLLVAQHAAAEGVTCIDHGKGGEEYKRVLANDGVELAEGAVDTRKTRLMIVSALRQARSWARATPLGPPARSALGWFRKLRR